jgi:anti-sigma-K factor RskA
MSPAHEEFDELAAAHALGALDGEDAVRFRAHLQAGCAECTQALDDYERALVRVAADVREAPPARVRHALLKKLGPVPGTRPSALGAALRTVAGMAIAAGLAALVTGAYLRGQYEGRIEQVAREAAGLRNELAAQVATMSELRARVTEQERTLTMVRAESAELGRTLALLNDPSTQVVTLGGLTPSPAAQGRMIWNPRAGGLFVAVDLPAAPEGKTYELWAIAGGKPVPAGLFSVDAEGKGQLRVGPLEGVAAVDVFAVTLEPAGGVPSPTGEMYLASKAA